MRCTVTTLSAEELRIFDCRRESTVKKMNDRTKFTLISNLPIRFYIPRIILLDISTLAYFFRVKAKVNVVTFDYRREKIAPICA